jgi:hypothetical protein
MIFVCRKRPVLSHSLTDRASGCWLKGVHTPVILALWRRLCVYLWHALVGIFLSVRFLLSPAGFLPVTVVAQLGMSQQY